MKTFKLPDKNISREAKDFISMLESRLPDRFLPLRPNQGEAIYLIVKYIQEVDNIFLDCPTGSGKSLIAVASAEMCDAPFYLCTFVNGLIDQYMRDFELDCIRGRANYDCSLMPGIHAGIAKCKFDAKFRDNCVEYLKGNCAYYNAVERAEASPKVLTTPQYIFRRVGGMGGLTHRPVVIIDEGHNTESFFRDLTGITITESRWEKYGLDGQFEDTISAIRGYKNDDVILDEWIDVLRIMIVGANEAIERARASMRFVKDNMFYEEDDDNEELRELERDVIHANSFVKEAETMLFYQEQGGIFVIGYGYSNGGRAHVELKPVNIYDFGEKLLDTVADKRIFMSATIPRPPQVFSQALGIDEDNCIAIQVEEHPFPVENRIVNKRYAGSMVRKHINKTKPKMLGLIEDIMLEHDKRGLILPYTHELKKYFSENMNSRLSGRLFFNDNYRVALEEFLNSSRKDAVLISTVNEGLDLHGDLAEFLIIPKVPYPNINDSYVKKRMKTAYCNTCKRIYIPDKKNNNCETCGSAIKRVGQAWYNGQVAITVVQMCGRATRNPDEKTYIAILDSAFEDWLRRGNRKILPKWFLESLK